MSRAAALHKELLKQEIGIEDARELSRSYIGWVLNPLRPKEPWEE